MAACVSDQDGMVLTPSRMSSPPIGREVTEAPRLPLPQRLRPEFESSAGRGRLPHRSPAQAICRRLAPHLPDQVLRPLRTTTLWPTSDNTNWKPSSRIPHSLRLPPPAGVPSSPRARTRADLRQVRPPQRAMSHKYLLGCHGCAGTIDPRTHGLRPGVLQQLVKQFCGDPSITPSSTRMCPCAACVPHRRNIALQMRRR